MFEPYLGEPEMLNVIIAFAFMSASTAAAAETKTVVDCQAVKIVNDRVFEEGLSTHEYPSVYIEADSNGQLVSASVGANIDYERKSGDVVRALTPEAGRNRYLLRYAKGRMAVIITVSQSSGPRPGAVWGNLSVQNENELSTEVAVLVCKK